MNTISKPRVIGYIPLMYGKEYLDACIRSMAPFVEVIHIFYVSEPSQGHAASVPCPESEQELYDIAKASSDKVEWHKCVFGNEGEHRNEIFKYTEGYDLVLTLDADEVIDPECVPAALYDAWNGDRRYYGISGFWNFWRSFNEVCLDGFVPVRIINLHNDSPFTGVIQCPIFHFSCAQSEKIIRYKWEVSGHKDELRPNWINETLYSDKKIDLHPVSINLWNATPFNRHVLPDILKQHPNFNKESI
jgi:hypothetical protein